MTLALLLAPSSARALVEGSYSYSVSGGQATIIGFNKAYSGPLDIPATLGGFPVTAIGPNAFYSANGITDVTIPAGVATINTCAFRFCANLQTIAIPASVQVIGGGVFDDCYSMESITVDESNPSFSSVQGVLYNKVRTTLLKVPCGRSGSFVLPEGLTGLSSSAFAACRKLTSLAIPADFKGVIVGIFFRTCNALATFSVDPANPVYSVGESGELVNKAQIRLVRLPPAFTVEARSRGMA